MQLPPELSFLSPLLIEPSEAYKTASWLLSNFEDQIWEYSFSYETPKKLDWSIALEDGSLLIAPKNDKLLRGFKYFLTTCTRDASGYLAETDDAAKQSNSFRLACHIIDYLLIHSNRYQLSLYGLEGLTGGNLIEILDALTSKPTTSESIYNWSNRLRKYCLTLAAQTDKHAITEIIKKNPKISVITKEQLEDDTLGIPQERIPEVRAALYLKNLYHTQQSTGNQPNTILLSQEIYPETLSGKNLSKSIHHILCYNESASLFVREYPAAPIRSGPTELMRDKTYIAYRRTLYNLGGLHEVGLPAPTIEALIEVDKFIPKISASGRFRSLPSEHVFKSIRNAIDFHLAHGDELVKAFCRISLECKKLKIPPTSITQENIQKLIGPKLTELGVNRLSLAIRPVSTGHNRHGVKGEKLKYFESLRKNAGLFELIAVYVGGIQLTVGVLMARRVSELYNLEADGCLDNSEQWLIFGNAKSTRHLFGYRRKEARPIEPITVDMIKNLIKMQKILKRIGYIPKLQKLFSAPHRKGAASLTDCSVGLYNRHLDIFCDYFETPLNSAGERYYFRQHQLRRFFAMLFFYCGSFARIDTLRWMLGHTDPRHVYRYITESTDGAVLAGAKAHYVAEQLHQGNVENFLALADLLKKRHGTDNFSLIDANDLEDQIQDLMQEGWVEIEPEFFTDHQGQKFKVVARLIREDEA